MQEREKSSVLNNPGMVDVVFVEEMFFLHLYSDLPKTFEFIRSILRKLRSSLFFLFLRLNVMFEHKA